MVPKTQTTGEDAILAGLLADDRKVVDSFYHHLKRRAFGLFCRHTPPGSPDYLAMEDSFSNAFLLLLRKVRSGAYEHRNLESYALSVVRFSFWDARKRGRRHLHALREEVPEMPEPEPPACHSATDFFDSFTNVRLLHWYESLDQEKQHMLDLQVQGYNHREVAALQRRAHGTVRNQFSKLMREARRVVAA